MHICKRRKVLYFYLDLYVSFFQKKLHLTYFDYQVDISNLTIRFATINHNVDYFLFYIKVTKPCIIKFCIGIFHLRSFLTNKKLLLVH